MAQLDDSQVRSALTRVVDPDRGADVIALGMVESVDIRGDEVHVVLAVDPKRGPALEPLRQAAERAVAALPGVRVARAILTAETPAASQRPAAPARPQPAEAAKLEVPGVRAIVAVASGKGGVGKSTTAVNLALAMAAEGARVGLLDADVYGPSTPRMMGAAGRPTTPDGKRIEPLRAYGIPLMSMGFFVEEDSPMIWRGPMVQSSIRQMLRDVNWGELDVLVVDMPPGTGDAQLTLAQQVPLAGAIIVSTPQDIALIDARKGLNMFRKVDVPTLGIVENMSYYSCPNCGHRADVFGHGGARAEAERLGVEFLGEIPLDLDIRLGMDEGRPVAAAAPDSPHAAAYRAIARRALEKLGQAGARRAPPRIVID